MPKTKAWQSYEHIKNMNAPVNKLAATLQTPVFPQTLHQLRPNSKAAGSTSKPPKRDNILSKSRDTREDRGTREMKTSHNARSFSHGR
jgi:hypothetical protein